MRDFIGSIKDEMRRIRFDDVEIWITEMSDYSGKPIAPNREWVPEYNFHSERYHASQVIKRYVYSLACGVRKIFWIQMEEWNNFAGGGENRYFDNVGLVNNPRNSDGLSHRKLGYYSYKLMTEKLKGADWLNVSTVREDDGVVLVRFDRKGRSVWVAWNDNKDKRTVTISGIRTDRIIVTEAVPECESGKDVKGYEDAFRIEYREVKDRTSEIRLSSIPFFIEEQSLIGSRKKNGKHP